MGRANLSRLGRVARHLAYSFAYVSGLSMKMYHKIPATPLIAITQWRAMSGGNTFSNKKPISPAAPIEAIQWSTFLIRSTKDL